LTDILDPNIFDSHKTIIDAMFSCYSDLSDFYLEQGKTVPTKIESEVKEKFQQKFGLEIKESEIRDLIRK
jgi:hypothetical protein